MFFLKKGKKKKEEEKVNVIWRKNNGKTGGRLGKGKMRKKEAKNNGNMNGED